MKIILLAGKAFSGKSMVAHLLKNKFEQLKMRTVITEYSKYIKLYAKEMLEWDGDTLEKPRDFLQEIGSFVRENLRMPNLFIDRMKEDFLVYERFFDVVIISDVRLPKEISEMKNTYKDVTAILILREEQQKDLTKKQKAHPTENALDDFQGFDYIINSDLYDIDEKLQEIVEELI